MSCECLDFSRHPMCLRFRLVQSISHVFCFRCTMFPNNVYCTVNSKDGHHSDSDLYIGPSCIFCTGTA